MEIHDLSDVFRESEFRVFKQIVADGGVVRGFAVKGGNEYSRSRLDAIVDQAKALGFTGLIWVRPGDPPLSSVKALSDAVLRPALDRAGATAADLLLMAAGPADQTSKLLGALRLQIAQKENLLNPEQYEFLWVTDFPLLEYSAEDGRWYSMHHPFTSPHDEDWDKLESQPGEVRAKAYDLVLNGSEIGGGSVRIHSAELQARIFARLASCAATWTRSRIHTSSSADAFLECEGVTLSSRHICVLSIQRALVGQWHCRLKRRRHHPPCPRAPLDP